MMTQELSQAIQEIVRIGRERAPHECCGLIASRIGQSDLEGDVLELANESLEPWDSYELSAEAMRSALSNWFDAVDSADLASGYQLLVWHTHPSGRAGPSQGDLRSRVPGVKYLVVTLDGEAVRY